MKIVHFQASLDMMNNKLLANKYKSQPTKALDSLKTHIVPFSSNISDLFGSSDPISFSNPPDSKHLDSKPNRIYNFIQYLSRK